MHDPSILDHQVLERTFHLVDFYIPLPVNGVKSGVWLCSSMYLCWSNKNIFSRVLASFFIHMLYRSHEITTKIQLQLSRDRSQIRLLSCRGVKRLRYNSQINDRIEPWIVQSLASKIFFLEKSVGFLIQRGHYNFIDYHRLSYLDYCIYIWGEWMQIYMQMIYMIMVILSDLPATWYIAAWVVWMFLLMTPLGSIKLVIFQMRGIPVEHLLETLITNPHQN